MTINKKETGKKILDHIQKTTGSKVDVDGFWEHMKTVANIRAKCKLFKIEIVYNK